MSIVPYFYKRSIPYIYVTSVKFQICLVCPRAFSDLLDYQKRVT
jgi:hypothetical protein